MRWEDEGAYLLPLKGLTSEEVGECIAAFEITKEWLYSIFYFEVE
jgi:hypothetical protein